MYFRFLFWNSIEGVVGMCTDICMHHRPCSEATGIPRDRGIGTGHRDSDCTATVTYSLFFSFFCIGTIISERHRCYGATHWDLPTVGDIQILLRGYGLNSNVVSSKKLKYIRRTYKAKHDKLSFKVLLDYIVDTYVPDYIPSLTITMAVTTSAIAKTFPI